jgi:hypothetical protein
MKDAKRKEHLTINVRALFALGTAERTRDEVDSEPKHRKHELWEAKAEFQVGTAVSNMNRLMVRDDDRERDTEP